MKQEMRKLNRTKYARSPEEMEQLAAQGYVPAGTSAAGLSDGDPGKKDKKKKQPVPGQPAADPAQADGGGSGK